MIYPKINPSTFDTGLQGEEHLYGSFLPSYLMAKYCRISCRPVRGQIGGDEEIWLNGAIDAGLQSIDICRR
jgi:hypothetical protein